MELYSEGKNYKLYQGDMLDMLDVVEENSIDSIVTDPPYELNFMNKGWDNAGISFKKETWEQCFKALKPGGHLLAFGGTRTYHRIACAIEDAGFEIRDCIMWIYGSGFPKSMDISKQIDKRGGCTVGWFGDYLKDVLKERGMSYSDLSKYFPSKSGNLTGRVSNWINNLELPTNEQFNKVCEILNLPFSKLEEAERVVVGKGKAGLTKGSIANFSGKTEFDLTIPTTDVARKWEGWGTQLKPSYEPIIIARKPVESSITENVMKWGVGGYNIDECRVPLEDGYEFKTTNRKSRADDNVFDNSNCGFDSENNTNASADPKGRFPANTILTYDETDFDEVCGNFPNSKGASSQNNYSNGHIYRGQSLNESQTSLNGFREWYNDSGSASRYFYCAKASKKDRDAGLEEMDAVAGHGKGNGLDRVCEFCGVSQLTPELCHCETKSWVAKPKKNFHPTVKPTELMQYLVKLVTPRNGIVLDPFNGSGSTGKAVLYENKERDVNYSYIGIELTPEYLPISKARLDFVNKTV